MSISEQALANDIQVVIASGRLDQSQTSHLEATLQNLLQRGYQKIIVDMGKVTYINSGGLRCLVTAWRMAREKEGDLILCCLTSRVEDVFQMVGFDKVFRVFETRAEAAQIWEASPS